jgi:hypothetical protein
LKKIWIYFFSFFSTLYAEFDWIDLPKQGYQEIFLSNDRAVLDFERCMQEYYGIDFLNEKCLKEKIAILQNALILLEECKKVSFDLTLLMIDQLKKRINYLENIYTIINQKELFSKKWQDYHLSLSEDFDAGLRPLFLRNNLSYSIKMKEFWGAFWLESIDPCHRRIGGYFAKWLEEKTINQNLPTFFLWLENQNIPKNFPIVKYLDDETLKHYKVMIENGRLFYELNHKIVDFQFINKRILFVIDLNKDFFIAPFEEGLWHSSFSKGKPVLAAGLIKVIHGIVSEIAFDSGHYLPELKYSYQTIQLLMEKQVRFLEEIDIIYYLDRCRYKITIPSFKLHNEEAFFQSINDPAKRQLLSTCNF